jgi:hypothetical protein
MTVPTRGILRQSSGPAQGALRTWLRGLGIQGNQVFTHPVAQALINSMLFDVRESENDSLFCVS